MKKRTIAFHITKILVALYALTVFYMVITTTLSDHGKFDFYIFLRHAGMFISDGMLYSRDLSLYSPGSPIYKFPPLYAGVLAEVMRAGISENRIYLGAWASQVISFIGGIILCSFTRTGKSISGNFLLTTCILAFSFSNGFFIENTDRLQLEPYVFFLASASIFLLTGNKTIGAGYFISIAATLKVYPALLLLHSVFLRRNWPMAIGAALGFSTSLLVSIWLINVDEHVFYALHILPKLLTESINIYPENISISRILIPFFSSIVTAKILHQTIFLGALAFWLFLIIRHSSQKIGANSNDTVAIDFSALFMIMLIWMPNFWLNYQLLNLLPAIISIKIIARKPRAHTAPIAALAVTFALQNIATTAPFFWPGFYTTLTHHGGALYITLRGLIQISLLIAVLLLQWQTHQANQLSMARSKIMKKCKIAILVISIFSAFGYWFAAIPTTATPEGVFSQEVFKPGFYGVIADDFKAIDESRPTPANNEFSGSPSRTLKGKIWRPLGLQEPGPLLIYSHGFMSFHQEGLYLARFLAEHGFTVVAVDYPLTNFFAPGKPKLADVVNQPGDVTFLIDTMLKRSADQNDALYNTIDPQKIAVAGVSLGGMTSTLVTYHRQVRDPRIAAAISIAGPASMFTSDFFAGSTVPFMMIAGDADAMVPYTNNARPIPQKYPGSILVTLKNASHAGFAQPASTFMRFFGNPDSLGCKQLRKGLENTSGTSNGSFMPGMDAAEYGIDLSDRTMPCSGEIPDTAMKAARQHMFTTLAAYAFLESIFNSNPEIRTFAENYLLKTLPEENVTEITVTK